MQYINFNPELMNIIKSGEKSATTRLGIKEKYSLGEVRLYNAKDRYDIVRGKEIYKIERMPFGCLSDDIAELEGYDCKQELQSALVEIYGSINDHDNVTIIYWI